MIDQQSIEARRTLICNSCGTTMKAFGSWPRKMRVVNDKAVLDSDEVYTSYWCETVTCRTEFTHTKKSDGTPYIGRLNIKVLEPDLYVGPAIDPEYEWEIYSREAA